MALQPANRRLVTEATADAVTAAAIETPDSDARAALTAATAADAADPGTALGAHLNATFARTQHRPVNARDLGADPTGVDDISTVLPQFVGRDVHFPAGHYRFDFRAATLTPGTKWTGDKGTVLFTGAESAAYQGLLVLPDDFTLQNLEIDAAEISTWALHVTGANVMVEDVTVRNSMHHGVYLDGNTGASNATFSRVRAVDCGRYRVSNDTAASFYASRVSGLRFTDCTSVGSRRQGWYVAGSGVGRGASLTACSAIGGGSGIDIRQPGASVQGCWATGNLGTGLLIQLEDTGLFNRHTTVNGGSFWGNNLDGGADTFEVLVSRGDLTTLNGVTAEGDPALTTNALSIQGSEGVTVTGGYYSGKSGLMVKTIGGRRCSDVVVTGGVFRGDGTSNVAIISDADRVLVQGNQFRGGVAGIRLLGEMNDLHLGPNQWTSLTGARVQNDATGTGGRNLLNAATLTNPGVASGTDASVINAVVTALRAQGIVL